MLGGSSEWDLRGLNRMSKPPLWWIRMGTASCFHLKSNFKEFRAPLPKNLRVKWLLTFSEKIPRHQRFTIKMSSFSCKTELVVVGTEWELNGSVAWGIEVLRLRVGEKIYFNRNQKIFNVAGCCTIFKINVRHLTLEKRMRRTVTATSLGLMLSFLLLLYFNNIATHRLGEAPQAL